MEKITLKPIQELKNLAMAAIHIWKQNKRLLSYSMIKRNSMRLGPLREKILDKFYIDLVFDEGCPKAVDIRDILMAGNCL